MILARTQCPDDWTIQYAGYLVSDYAQNADRKRSSYVCLELDETPQVAIGRTAQKNALIYPVEVLDLWNTTMFIVSNRERADLVCILCSK